MLAARLPSILPPLTPRELLEVSMIHSVAGALAGGELTDRRPFRAPHHSASMPALVGGGSGARPGEISLAHNGVLFLDELPEFQPQALDALRQPLETGEVAISRANHRCVYPARFQLVAAMNPCRCGHALEPGYSCRRGEPKRCAQSYQTRLSGPLLDRIDLHLEVAAIRASDVKHKSQMDSQKSAGLLARGLLAKPLATRRRLRVFRHCRFRIVPFREYPIVGCRSRVSSDCNNGRYSVDRLSSSGFPFRRMCGAGHWSVSYSCSAKTGTKAEFMTPGPR